MTVSRNKVEYLDLPVKYILFVAIQSNPFWISPTLTNLNTDRKDMDMLRSHIVLLLNLAISYIVW